MSIAFGFGNPFGPHKGRREVAGLRTTDVRYREGTQFCLVTRGPALGEVHVNGHFGLMYRRTNGAYQPSERTFAVMEKSGDEYTYMTHAELVEAVNKLADAAE